MSIFSFPCCLLNLSPFAHNAFLKVISGFVFTERMADIILERFSLEMRSVNFPQSLIVILDRY